MPRAPLSFEPLFMERVWGGRRLAERYGKRLPEGAVVGESWELVDRPETASIVRSGEFAGRSLGDLWRSERREALFGADARHAGESFPLLIKLLDCEQTLSVQVHPPAEVAAELGGEPKTEMWIILGAEPGAHLFAGLRAGVTCERFERALSGGDDVSELLHRQEVVLGDVMFLPSGRVHAIGAGCLILEIQQNSDTTYRVFDFNRPGLDGQPRQLHVEESLRSIDWDDAEPPLVVPDGDALVHNDLFDVDRLTLLPATPATAAPEGRCAALVATDGAVRCGGESFRAGELFLVRADAEGSDRELAVDDEGPVTVIRAMLPSSR